MCGIGLIVERKAADTPEAKSEHTEKEQSSSISFLSTAYGQELVQRLKHRGPDISAQCCINLEIPCGDHSEHFELTFLGSVLGLRGLTPTQQPLQGDKGDIFLWNGEIFGGVEVAISENDGLILFHRLTQCDTREEIEYLLDTTVQGPYGFIYWQAMRKRLWFGRDKVGRRSLMLHRPKDRSDDTPLIISSVGYLPPKDEQVEAEEKIENEKEREQQGKEKETEKGKRGGRGDDDEDDEDEGGNKVGYQYWEELPIDGLFCLDFSSSSSSHKEKEVKDELLLRDEELYGGLVHLAQYRRPLFPPFERKVLGPVEEMQEKELSFPEAVEGLHKVLSEAVRVRVCNIPSSSDGKARLGVLFSGGLDSIVLARLADLHLPQGEPIDLLNVSFMDEKVPTPIPRVSRKKAGGGRGRGRGQQQPQQQQPQQSQQPATPPPAPVPTGYDRAPDRQTGIRGWWELKLLSPGRPWNFVEVNVNSETYARSQREVLALIHPGESVMDHSIASAIWFAARGEGVIRSDEELLASVGMSGQGPVSSEKEGKWVGQYTSTARVLLIGSGADEQLGGYTRHRNAFKRSGWEGLQAELTKDTSRIWKRNLGRDDRVIASTGKEMRSPYLDENVTVYLNLVPLYLVCDPREKPGVGDKKILRQVGREIGLSDSTTLVKRAIQFGSRIAKMQPAPAGGGGRKGRNMDTQKIQLQPPINN